MLKIIKHIFLLLSIFLVMSCDSSSQSKNNSKNIINVRVFSSLTCPHCADFHFKVYEKLKKDYINIGRVKFEHVGFPLDLAALNAEKILQCDKNPQTKFEFLTEIYKKQKIWASGSDISIINNSLKNIGKEFALTENAMNKCLIDKNLEEKILNESIQAQKNYKISSTPTIYINENKYEGKRNYESFKKEIEKFL